jgi:hypothetical protein
VLTHPNHRAGSLLDSLTKGVQEGRARDCTGTTHARTRAALCFALLRRGAGSTVPFALYSPSRFRSQLSIWVWREYCYKAVKEQLLSALFSYIERDRNGAMLDKSLVRDMIESLSTLHEHTTTLFYSCLGRSCVSCVVLCVVTDVVSGGVLIVQMRSRSTTRASSTNRSSRLVSSRRPRRTTSRSPPTSCPPTASRTT